MATGSSVAAWVLLTTGCLALGVLSAPGLGAGVPTRPAVRGLPGLRPQAPLRVLVVVALIGASLVVRSSIGTAVLLLVGAAAGVIVRWLMRERASRRDALVRRTSVIELCDALVAELAAGLPTSTALVHACGSSSEWQRVIAVQRLGGDVAAELRRSSQARGAEGLASVARAWQVAADSGAPLSTVLDRVAVGLRADEEARAEVEASLGPPRATARLLAVLPVFGIGLGVTMGAHPVGFLLTTTVGRGCLGAGVLLALLGLVWVERLAAAVEVGR